MPGFYFHNCKRARQLPSGLVLATSGRGKASGHYQKDVIGIMLFMTAKIFTIFH